MDLDDLKSFQIVARELSFTRAAKELHLSQPALSKRIQRLERALGTSLFDRNTSRVVLTAAGSQFLATCGSLVRSWDEAIGLVARVASDRAAPRLTVRLATWVVYSGQLAKHFAEAVPWIDVALQVAAPERAMELLRDGEIDVAIIYQLPGGPGTLEVDGAWVRTIASEPQWVMMGPGHALADRDAVTVRDFSATSTPWFVSPDGAYEAAWEREFLLSRDPDAELVVASDSSLWKISRGRGVALASPQNQPNESLFQMPLEPLVSWQHQLVWIPDRLPRQNAIDLFGAAVGFHQRRAQGNPRYWKWLRDNPGLSAEPIVSR